MTRTTGSTKALLLTALLSTGACDGLLGSSAEMSYEARSYLEQVVELMQSHSINRLKIDWGAFRTNVFEAAAGAQRSTDTYAAVRVALGLLGDGHSYFSTPSGAIIAVATRACYAVQVNEPTLPGTIGYVRVGAFRGTATQATSFATEIQRSIRSRDGDHLVGWIVDLRGNTGGNMWSMITGLGPVLGEGVVGHFIDPLGGVSVWEHREGAARLDGEVMHQVDSPYRLRRERPRVAVLTDKAVASSGEAVVVAFRKRPDTRFFGTATCGLSTANRGFSLSDGAALWLTGAVMADRTRFAYGDSISPDELATAPAQAVQHAVAWLQSRN